MSLLHKSLPYLLVCLACGLVRTVSASEPDAAPDEVDLCPPGHRLYIPPPPPGTVKGEVRASADSASMDSESITTFTGNVMIQQDGKQLDASTVTYDRASGLFKARDEIVFSAGEMRLQGDYAEMNLQTDQGFLDNGRFQVGTVNGRGTATQIILQNRKEIALNEATYTTCPQDDMAWQLSASEIHLNNENHQGTAKHMVLRVGHIPILYVPYIRFPIGEERLSGFLFPGIGVSDRHGTEVTIPYYWNIAPNMDATITPHNMTRRGLMLETEFRYLTRNNKGSLDVDFLPDDKVYGEDRESFTWIHQGTPGAGWSTSVDYRYVSDIDYLDDFSGSFTTASITHLERRGTLSYNHPQFVFAAQAQDYQNLSGTQPYKRLPQLRFDTRMANLDNELNYDLISEYVRYDHRDANLVTGDRIMLAPYLSYPLQATAGFAIPKLTLNHLQYELEQTAPGQRESQSVSVPVFSLDTGIFLERDTSFAGIELLHTLEPRLFYVYAPYRDQSELPVFDTALTTFSQSLLFAENRFSGYDRIGDANQVTAALATRFYRADNGTELFSATAGQILYFRDREVVLPGNSVQTDTRSSYLGQLSFTPHRNWRLTGDIQWNPDTTHTEVGNTRLQFRANENRIVNMDYRFRRNEIRTQGLSFAWRINPRWQVLGGTLYDRENDREQETFAGVRYDDCCWGARLVWRKLFDRLEIDNTPRYEHAIYLELELKGFSSLGSRKEIDTLLENGILGYSQ